MDFLLDFIRNMTLSDIGSIISIISFIFTVIMFFDIKSIKKYYFFAARVPEVTNKLKISLQKLATYQDDFDHSIQHISLELAKVEVVLNSLKNKLDRPHRKSVLELLDTIQSYKPKQHGKDAFLKIYVKIHKVLEEVDELQRDSKWER